MHVFLVYILMVMYTGQAENLPGHSGIRTSVGNDLWNTNPNALPTELHGQDGLISDISEQSVVPSIPNTRII